MDRCPTEICREIYAFACVDDGRTGRSLSLVSRYISETSQPYKLQSVSVIGHSQLFAFADLIQKTPLHLRNVQYIFISAHSRHTASHPKALSPEYVQRQESYAAVERILRAIAPCVKILHAFFVFYRPFILLPVSLPVLEELMLHGPLETSTEIDNSIQFASLSHLNLTSSCSPSYLLNKVLTLTPSLIYLRISASDRSEAVANEWSSIFANWDTVIPSSLKKIFIHAPTKPKLEYFELVQLYDRIMTALSRLADKDKRVVLLPPQHLDLFSMISIQEAIATWASRAAGLPWW